MLARVDDRLCGVFAVIERAAAAKTLDALDAVMTKAFAEFGVDYFSVDQMRDGAGRMVGEHHLGNWPEDWGAHYLQQQHYKHDYIVKHAILSPSPKHWLAAQAEVELAPEEKRLFGEAAEFGLKDGFITPIPQVDGNIASVSLTSRGGLDVSPANHHLLTLVSSY